MKKYFVLKKYQDFLQRKATSIFWGLMKIDSIRFYFCKVRWNYYKNNFKILDNYTSAVGVSTVDYNLSAFNNNAVFGMGKRMSLLLYPLVALLRDYHSPSVLIVGPRSEDDIFWARALGLSNTLGLDLFTYSKFVQLGDIHSTNYPNQSFDAILLGWMISYSSEPNKVINECKRLIKSGGFLGIGVQSDPAQKFNGISAPRMNHLNSSEDLISLVNEEIVFVHDPKLEVAYECAVILKLRKS
ncbi:MAG: methyltransferase domain-containing protein [Microcystis sp. M046S1]|uniref:methyltransferase domain-containing protein n=1 Tax=Microcystis sp. M046S1 TaxID=2771118 RepID=UPI002586E018|nr:methyltransferase domain-containing protein [Microcystis sp. M046S1]MCA2882100.1 methyltransferase domain-containing protein [Microcystis sp. M046S1]